MSESLPTPPEPKEIRKALRALADATGRAPYIVFTGNRLAKYLWDNWSTNLKTMGLTWKDLLQTLSRHSKEALDWVTGDLPWEAFIARLAWDLERKSKNKDKKRSILDFIE